MTAHASLRALTLFAFCTIAVPALAQEAVDLAALRQQALELANASRAEAGLPALEAGPILDEAAQGHADDMLARGYYDHVTPEGETPADRFRAAGGSEWALSGENIARCTGCEAPPDGARVEAFHAGWMQSTGHRENILEPGFDRFGFGIAGSGDRTYAVQTFAGPGEDAGGPALDDAGVRAAALGEVNERRADGALPPLQPSEALDAVAARVLDARQSGEELPAGLFELLPEGATGWTGIAVRSASRGGSGRALSREDVGAFVEDWASSGESDPLGGERMGHLGFAAATQDDGRATAVAVFGRRE